MRIEISCPEITCTRCRVTAAAKPLAIRAAGSGPFFVGGKSAAPVAGFVVESDDGVNWQVVQSLEPSDWGKGPNGEKFCPACAAAWEETAAAFADGTLSKKALRHLPKARALPPPPPEPLPESLPRGVQKIIPPPEKPRPTTNFVPLQQRTAAQSGITPSTQRINVAATPISTPQVTPVAAPRAAGVDAPMVKVSGQQKIAPIPAAARSVDIAPTPAVVRGPAAVSPMPNATQVAQPAVQSVGKLPAAPTVAPVPQRATR